MNSWFKRLERRLAPYAIPNLGGILAVLQAATWCMLLAKPQWAERLMMNGVLVLQGEYYRLLTFLAVPHTLDLLSLLGIYFFYFMATALEANWGTVKLNLYLLLSWLSTVLVSFVFSGYSTSFYLDQSLFLAFAWMFPEFVIYLFFIIPIKVKYLALLYWAGFLSVMVYGDWLMRGMMLAKFGNFLIFFGADVLGRMRAGRRRMEHEFVRLRNERTPFHRCAECGVTDKDNPKLEFRFCSKCQGDLEYCEEHLRTHDHRTAQDPRK